MGKIKLRSLLLLHLLGAACGLSPEVHNEELLIKPLPSGHVYAFFSFSTSLQNPTEPLSFYRFFPMTIGDLLQNNALDEFHLSLSQGKWSHEKWGYPIKDRPAGSVLWAWFRENPDENWKKFTSSLGGIVCSSLNFIDDTITVVPKYLYRPEGHIDNLNITRLKLAMLPGEAVCTENLTPWEKLLPCPKSGLVELLSATNIFSSHYISIGLDVKRTCLDSICSSTQLIIQQHVSVVFDPAMEGKQDWSFYRLFGRPLTSTCPLADKSTAIIDISENGISPALTLTPPPDRIERIPDEDKVFAVYDLKKAVPAAKDGELSIIGKYAKGHTYWTIKQPPLTAQRLLQGYGLESGGIRTVIKNNLDIALNISYLDVIPWYLRVYTHTLKITSNGRRALPSRIVFQPALDREKPCHFELGLTLLPHSTTEIYFDFDRAFLGWTEYPPDPHLGFYIGAATISLSLPPKFANHTADLSSSETLELALLHPTQRRSLMIFTEILLVTLPTPDFSMPYNVICFVCTALALAFGPIHNITTKQLVLSDTTQKKSLIQRILQKLKGVSIRKAKKE